MRNILLFIILANFTPLIAHTLPNNIISDCNLPAPSNLHTVEVGPSYATMAWNAVPGATGYYVSWYDESGTYVNSETTLDTEYEVQGLESGKTYNVRVASICNNGGTGTIYSLLPVVPIVTELVISTDNPLGNLVETCSQIVNPVAECTFDFNFAPTYIGKIKVIELNRVYYFRVRYFGNLGIGDNSKVVLDLVKPEFYPELPVHKPGLYTEYGSSSGQIYDHGDAKTNFYVSLFEIRISKISNKLYKINLKKTNTQSYSLEFSYSYINIPTYANNENQQEDIFSSKSSETREQYMSNIYLKIFNSLGELIRDIKVNAEEEIYQNYLENLPSGLYIIYKYSSNSIFSKKIIIDAK